MDISEVRVRLIPNRNNQDRLRAFCSITFDGDFVIRDLKVIDGVNGIFVAMPSRKLADRCPRCRSKNHLRARFCNECGAKLSRRGERKDSGGRPKYHADVAHPINSECRARIEEAVREAYHAELERSKEPDYQPSGYDDDDYVDSDYDDLIADLKRDAAKRRADRDRGRRDTAGSAARRSDEETETDVADISDDTTEDTGESDDDRPAYSTTSATDDEGEPEAPTKDASVAAEDQPSGAPPERGQEEKAEPTAEKPSSDENSDFGAGLL
jgi:stage V sporulation protein G